MKDSLFLGVLLLVLKLTKKAKGVGLFPKSKALATVVDHPKE